MDGRDNAWRNKARASHTHKARQAMDGLWTEAALLCKLRRAGFIVSKKSVLEPTPTIVFVGKEVDGLRRRVLNAPNTLAQCLSFLLAGWSREVCRGGDSAHSGAACSGWRGSSASCSPSWQGPTGRSRGGTIFSRGAFYGHLPLCLSSLVSPSPAPPPPPCTAGCALLRCLFFSCSSGGGLLV